MGTSGGRRPTFDTGTSLHREGDLFDRPADQADLAGAGTREITASAVPGSDFRGQGSHEAAPEQTQRLVEQGREALSRVGEGHGGLRIELQSNGSHRVTDAHGAFTIDIRADHLPGDAAARSTLDHERGNHVIELSDQLAPKHVERAIAHEIGEIAEDRNRAFTGHTNALDADAGVLRPGDISADAKLTPHDVGRVQELRVLGEQLDRLPSADNRAPGQQRKYDGLHRESMALVEHLGLRDGTPGAEQRRGMVFDRLPPAGQDHVRSLFGDAGRSADALPPHDQALLDSIQQRVEGPPPVDVGVDQPHDREVADEPSTRQVLTAEPAPAPDAHKATVDEHDANEAAETFLLLCTEYSPKKGGVVVFNRALAEGLADAGQNVVVRVGEDVAPYADLQRPNLRIVGPRNLPAEPESSKLLGAENDPEGMPEHVDYVIGHTRFSGPDAKVTRDGKYPEAKLIHFVHMVPEALGRVKEDTEAGEAAKGVKNHAVERNLVAGADLAVGVGPAITENVREMVRQARENTGQTGEHVATQEVHELVPGMDFRDRGERSTEGRPLNVFIFGRTDVGQKGATEAAEVVGRLREAGSPVRLVVRGVPPELAERQQRALSKIVGDKVEVRPFTVERSDLLADLDDADVMVMTSRAEGFGLTALEAAAAGVPTVVPSGSGIGRWLSESGQFSADLTGPGVVEQGFEDQVPTDLWFDALSNVVADYPAAQQRALDLQQEFKDQNVSWETAVGSLVEKARGLQ